jgi:hypothetical protein
MGSKYTPEEDAIIIENYPKAMVPEWAYLLPDRTTMAIAKRARILGLHQKVGRVDKLKSMAINRFFSRIAKMESTGCWEWTGTTNNSGYGLMGASGDIVSAHRFSWMHHFGDIAEGLQVCHKCDNPKCVNPEHLFLGTNEDNQMDCVTKGRKPKKITLDDAVEIKRLLAEGITQPKIAKRIGVSDAIVRNIKYGKAWKHVR